MKKRILGLMILAGILAACSGEKKADNAPHGDALDRAEPVQLQSESTVDAYIASYAAKDIDAYLSLLSDDVLTILYPDRVYGTDKESVSQAVANDFDTRPGASLSVPDRFNIAQDKLFAFGRTIDGEQFAPVWLLFDLTDDNKKIEGLYTHIGTPGFAAVPSVTGPTPGMIENARTLINSLRAGSIEGAETVFAPSVALYAYPPADVKSQNPIITGPNDVASVLNFKWGEGAFRLNEKPRQDTYISRHMQFLVFGIPGATPNSDRVAFITFRADPDVDDFEQIIRVDVMGPSGG